MEGGMVFDASNNNNITALLQNPSSEALESLWISNSCPTSFHGENNNESAMKPYYPQMEKEEPCDDDYEKCFHQPEKKRRLTVEQVRFLERSFEVENKLEPERKVQLAKELNLQPRQVAIWFQNRRARYKTKQLEKDYDVLKSSYDNLKLNFDSLQKDNDKLKHEVQMLTKKLLQREKGKEGSLPFEFPTKGLESESQKVLPIQSSTKNSNSEPKMVICKQEDANSVSAKSDIIDSDSPHYTDGNHSSSFEPADSSNVFENQSDFSQDEEDNLSKNILRFPKVEYESYIDPSDTSLGYPGEDHPFWFWP